VTVAGTLALSFAEFLGVATALQAVSPGARLVMGASGAVLDMRTTQISYAAPECALLAAAAVEVGHWLGFPVICSGMASDAKHPGVQAGYEKAIKGLVAAATGADLMSGGIGMLDAANLLFLPQILIDAEIVAVIERVLAGVEISDRTLLLDAVERVGIGGSFLFEKETSRRLREGEHFLPQISTRLSYESWLAQGKDEVDVAWERAQRLLAARQEPSPYLSAEQRHAFSALCGAGSID
jgi:trimethylamine---corrinoid protein Co-methyltransferase